MASPIAPALALIYPASYEQGQVPGDWKRAFVTPLFKNGDKSKGSNYRPVSLTSCCCKVMKHIVHSHLMKFLENNKILSDYQHGFRKKRSCRLSSSPLYMTWQLDWTDGNKLMQFCWISERLLIRFPISALQSSSITMAPETKTHPGSKAFSRIEISKWSLMGRIISCCCHIRSSTRHSAWASPVPGIRQWPARRSFLFGTTFCWWLSTVQTESYETNKMKRHYRQILIIYRNGKKNGKWFLTQTSANTSGSPTSERSYRLPTTFTDRPWMKLLKSSTLESL